MSDGQRSTTDAVNTAHIVSELEQRAIEVYAAALLNRSQLLLTMRDAGVDASAASNEAEEVKSEQELMYLLNIFRDLPSRKLFPAAMQAKESFLRGYHCELKNETNEAKAFYRRAVELDPRLEKSKRVQRCLRATEARSSMALSPARAAIGPSRSRTTSTPAQAGADIGTSGQHIETETVSKGIDRVELDSSKTDKKMKGSTVRFQEHIGSSNVEPATARVDREEAAQESVSSHRQSELFSDLIAQLQTEPGNSKDSKRLSQWDTLANRDAAGDSGPSRQPTGIDVGFRTNYPEGREFFDQRYGPSASPRMMETTKRRASNPKTYPTSPTSPVRHEYPSSTARRPSLTILPPRRLSGETLLSDMPTLEELPKIIKADGVAPNLTEIATDSATRVRRRSSCALDMVPTSPSSPSRLRQSSTISDDEGDGEEEERGFEPSKRNSSVT